MSVKSEYFKMNKEDFDKYLNDLKKSNTTIHLLNDKYFYVIDNESLNLILMLNKKMNELDLIINSFTDFNKKQIIQSFLLDEIDSTNKIERIFSTKHDIFSILNNVSKSNDKKIISISNAYKHLLNTKGKEIKSLEDIRNLYDVVLNNSIEKEDLPDGKYFRKNPVFITNGIKAVHLGIREEENINKLMQEFLDLYNSNNEIFTKIILSHFVFEFIHPFYDGNGRLGRFLFSNGLYLSSNSYFSFLISSSFEREKNKYYNAFKDASDKYEFGSLNTYVLTILEILINQIQIKIKDLSEKKIKMDNLILPFKMTKSEEKIYKFIYESSYFSTFGVSSKEIIEESSVSKRTLIYALNNLKSKNILDETKIGKFSYYKCKI